MDDYIKREDALKKCIFGRTSLGLADELKRLPAADVVEHKRGEWIPLKGMQPPELHGKHYCSNCDYILHLSLNGGVYNYCPNCGADMRERKDNE